jgi:hypothetical protein
MESVIIPGPVKDLTTLMIPIAAFACPKGWQLCGLELSGNRSRTACQVQGIRVTKREE